MMNVTYETGESRFDGEVVDYMMVLNPVEGLEDESWEDAHLYAEVHLEDDDVDEEGFETSEADDRHYEQLKAEVIAKAKKLGVDVNELKFFRD